MKRPNGKEKYRSSEICSVSSQAREMPGDLGHCPVREHQRKQSDRAVIRPETLKKFMTTEASGLLPASGTPTAAVGHKQGNLQPACVIRAPMRQPRRRPRRGQNRRRSPCTTYTGFSPIRLSAFLELVVHLEQSGNALPDSSVAGGTERKEERLPFRGSQPEACLHHSRIARK